jgi:hypothetical protein
MYRSHLGLDLRTCSLGRWVLGFPSIQGITESSLDGDKSATQWRLGIVVGRVPIDPLSILGHSRWLSTYRDCSSPVFDRTTLSARIPTALCRPNT